MSKKKKYIYTALNDFIFVIMEGNKGPKVQDDVKALTGCSNYQKRLRSSGSKESYACIISETG